MYASCSCSSVGLLYAPLLLMSLCPNIWSIQFTFTPPLSRLVWTYFRKLWAVMLGSLTLRNALLMSEEKECRSIRLTFPDSHVLNSGLFSVSFSGEMCREPFSLSFK